MLHTAIYNFALPGASYATALWGAPTAISLNQLNALLQRVLPCALFAKPPVQFHNRQHDFGVQDWGVGTLFKGSLVPCVDLPFLLWVVCVSCMPNPSHKQLGTVHQRVRSLVTECAPTVYAMLGAVSPPARVLVHNQHTLMPFDVKTGQLEQCMCDLHNLYSKCISHHSTAVAKFLQS